MLGKHKSTDLPTDDLDASDSDTVSPQHQERLLSLLQDVLENTQAAIKKTLLLLGERSVDTEALVRSLERIKDASSGFIEPTTETPDRVIEGVFNGDRMIGPDGKEYNVPPNYASKSKLVEGDLLKLSITGNGSFIYKQIGPIARKQLMVSLARDDRTGSWYGVQGSKRWKLVTASVTYFHGQPGDQVVILVPEDGESAWAAVENIIHA